MDLVVRLPKLAACVFAILLICPPMARGAELIAGGADEELAPFLWNWMDPISYTEEGLIQTAAKKDPLRPFFLAFRLLVDYERTGNDKALSSAERALDFMLDQYEPAERSPEGYRWFYGFDYERIKAPWWSGMDAMFGPMTLYAAYEITGKEHYKNVALSSIKRALTPPTEGGVLWRDDKGCWLSEYAWSGMKPADEYHVLNGHMWALQALFLMADKTQDPTLLEAYSCAREGTMSRAPDYLIAGGAWTKYQLNPAVIDPAHYETLELAQFRAMYALTGDDGYRAMMDERSNALRDAYPLYLTKDGAGFEVSFSLVGAPHPYWTDTYPITVECEASRQVFRSPKTSPYGEGSYADRMTITLPVPSIPSSCSVTAHSAVDVKVYTQTQFEVEPARPIALIAPKITTAFDAITVKENGDVIVSPNFKVIPEKQVASNDEARIRLEIDHEVGLSDVIAVALEPEQDFSAGIILEDDKGVTAARYYPKLLRGQRNLILINCLGFDGVEKLNRNIKSVTIRLFTKPDAEPSHVTISDLAIITTPLQMKEYLKKEETAYFPQQ